MSRRFVRKSFAYISAVGCLLGFVLAGSAEATPLGLTKGVPDISAFFITVDYNASTDNFSAIGFAFQLQTSSTTYVIDAGTFDLMATIDGSGVASAGTLTIGGEIPSLSFNSGTLLTGNLTAFGFPNAGGDPLEILFAVTGGDAAGLYPSSTGVILNFSGYPVPGSFADSFGNDGNGEADTSPTPEPATLSLALLGAGSLFAARKRMR